MNKIKGGQNWNKIELNINEKAKQQGYKKTTKKKNKSKTIEKRMEIRRRKIYSNSLFCLPVSICVIVCVYVMVCINGNVEENINYYIGIHFVYIKFSFPLCLCHFFGRFVRVLENYFPFPLVLLFCKDQLVLLIYDDDMIIMMRYYRQFITFK